MTTAGAIFSRGLLAYRTRCASNSADKCMCVRRLTTTCPWFEPIIRQSHTPHELHHKQMDSLNSWGARLSNLGVQPKAYELFASPEPLPAYIMSQLRNALSDQTSMETSELEVGVFECQIDLNLTEAQWLGGTSHSHAHFQTGHSERGKNRDRD